MLQKLELTLEDCEIALMGCGLALEGCETGLRSSGLVLNGCDVASAGSRIAGMITGCSSTVVRNSGCWLECLSMPFDSGLGLSSLLDRLELESDVPLLLVLLLCTEFSRSFACRGSKLLPFREERLADDPFLEDGVGGATGKGGNAQSMLPVSSGLGGLGSNNGGLGFVALRGFFVRLPLLLLPPDRTLEAGERGVCVVGPRKGWFAAAELILGREGRGAFCVEPVVGARGLVWCSSVLN